MHKNIEKPSKQPTPPQSGTGAKLENNHPKSILFTEKAKELGFDLTKKKDIDYNKMWFKLKEKLQDKTNWNRNQLLEIMREIEIYQIKD